MIHLPGVLRHQRKRIDDKGILIFRDAGVTPLATAGRGGAACPTRVAAGGTALYRRTAMRDRRRRRLWFAASAA